jgi:hypothetical protein
MVTNATHMLSLADVDAVLPAEFQILQPPDPHNNAPHALRVVRHETTDQTYAFDTPQEYLQFVLSVSPRRLLADVSHTRYIELSAQYDSDAYFHASVTHTVAAFTRSTIVLHRMKSDETSVRFELSREEMAALVSGYQSYLENGEQAGEDGEATRDPFLDFSDDLSYCVPVGDAYAYRSVPNVGGGPVRCRRSTDHPTNSKRSVTPAPSRRR